MGRMALEASGGGAGATPFPDKRMLCRQTAFSVMTGLVPVMTALGSYSSAYGDDGLGIVGGRRAALLEKLRAYLLRAVNHGADQHKRGFVRVINVV